MPTVETVIIIMKTVMRMMTTPMIAKLVLVL